ncbi:MAG: helix-turn-helix domain-containing protein, partial [Armatimonadetes bacterium]|nr:helix-turn-helix domain-containing protein [Armatimonadota bacterium]
MMPDHAACHEALRARDARFDGLFLVGVRTTGIYCRPVCPARTPHSSNCEFFRVAAQAEDAGFRPCLRCRPELAPGNARIDAVDGLARRVLERIEEGAVGEEGLGALAAELGVTPRHMRRVVRRAFGVTPVALVQTHRLLLAKRLLSDTTMRVIDVAHAAGFESLRRFNHLVRARYRLTPTQIRRSASPPAGESMRASLRYIPPFDWEALTAFLGGRAMPGVEHLDAGGAFHRTLRADDCTGWISVSNVPAAARVEVVVSPSLAPRLPSVLARVKRLLDLTANPQAITERLGALAQRRPGLRLPGCVDPFELVVRAVLGQQVSVRAASTLAARLASRFGTPIQTPHRELRLLFPTPEELAEATEAGLVELGIVHSRVRALLALSRAVAEGTLRLDSAVRPDEAAARLACIPGIGDWTAAYVAMRGLGWPDAFPAG